MRPAKGQEAGRMPRSSSARKEDAIGNMNNAIAGVEIGLDDAGAAALCLANLDAAGPCARRQRASSDRCDPGMTAAATDQASQLGDAGSAPHHMIGEDPLQAAAIADARSRSMARLQARVDSQVAGLVRSGSKLPALFHRHVQIL
jgi:hypothetical protein